MKFLRGGLITALTLTSLAIYSPHVLAATVSAGASDGPVQLLTELNFKSTTPVALDMPAAIVSSAVTNGVTPNSLGTDGWTIGAQMGGSVGVTAVPSAAVAQPSKMVLSTSSTVDALVGEYPTPSGGQYIWADYQMAQLNTDDVYIEFWARMPTAKEGCKFLKVFGQQAPSGYRADTTIYTDYTGADYGAIRQVAFGDGTSLTNDSQNVIMLNGTYPQWIGRSYGTAVVQTPQMSNFSSSDWGTEWHHFRIHVKYNSGTTAQNEVPNGEYYLEIDGKVYVDATGLYNRNPADGPIDKVEFFGWAQRESQPFELDYADIRISTGGFVSSTSPSSPTGVTVK